MDVFKLQWQSEVVATKPIWPANLKIFAICTFTEKVCQLMAYLHGKWASENYPQCPHSVFSCMAFGSLSSASIISLLLRSTDYPYQAFEHQILPRAGSDTELWLGTVKAVFKEKVMLNPGKWISKMEKIDMVSSREVILHKKIQLPLVLLKDNVVLLFQTYGRHHVLGQSLCKTWL